MTELAMGESGILHVSPTETYVKAKLMTDIVNRETRSRMMAGIRGKDTKPEMLVRRYLHATGLRFRLHDRTLPGSPDLVLPRYRSVVFVHGCFWHRHAGCKYTTSPSSRTEFWQGKFDANVARDKRNQQALVCTGWNVLVIWECETRSDELVDEIFWKIVAPHPINPDTQRLQHEK
jgi:DNA mismatch endonuclease (patch repair protein)